MSRYLAKLQGRETWLLFLLSVCIYGILGMISPQMGGDSGFYLQTAKDLAGGNLEALRNWPLHWFYSACLSIGYLIIPRYFLIFVQVFNVLVASLIPPLFYKISNLITGQNRLSFVVSLPIIFYPYFLFWSRYILTDIFFLTVLLLHILAVSMFLRKQGPWTLVGLILSSLALLFSRPTSLPVLLISAGFILFHRWGKKAVVFFTVGIMLCTVLVLGIPASRQKVLNLPTVYQSLWLSTRLSSTSAAEQLEAFKFEDEIPEGMPEAEFKLNYFRDFVTHHPGEYAMMCLKRFVAYWYPWIWGQWAVYHKIFDGLLSLFLTGLAFYALFNKRVSNYKYYFLFLALGFCMLTVFSQIDSDGRYRLPAELSLLLLVPLTISSWRGNSGIFGRAFTFLSGKFRP